MAAPDIKRVNQLLSISNLRSEPGVMIEHMGEQLSEALIAAGCATFQELFQVYVEANPLEESEWIHLLFTALDTIDGRNTCECPGCQTTH